REHSPELSTEKTLGRNSARRPAPDSSALIAAKDLTAGLPTGLSLQAVSGFGAQSRPHALNQRSASRLEQHKYLAGSPGNCVSMTFRPFALQHPRKRSFLAVPSPNNSRCLTHAGKIKRITRRGRAQSITSR